MAGRPTKLTPEVQERIVTAVAAGNYYEAAAAYGGVTHRTFINWMEWGEKARSGQYFQFFLAVKEAEAQAEVSIVQQWTAHIPESWQAARDFLGRRYPDRWGSKERQDVRHSMNPVEPFTFLIVNHKKGEGGDEGGDADGG